MQMKKKSRWLREYMGIFLLSVLPKIWLAMQTYPLKTFSDEVATIASAASLAGYDWSAVVSQAGYYGAGFYWIFAPVFWLTDNPIIIYRVMLVGCSLVQGLIAPIAYYMLGHYFHIEEKCQRVLMALCSSYLVMTRATILFNEHILILLVWISVLLLLKLQEHKDDIWKKRGYTVLLMGVFAYSMTIHTRMLTFWIALVLLLIVYGIINRRLLVSKSMAVLVGIGGYLLSKKVVAFVQNTLWNTANGGSLRNASVNVPLNHNFLSLRTWKAWISIIIGQIQTVNLVTGGLAVLILLFFVVFIVGWWKRFREKNENTEDMYHLIVIFFCVCCTGMTIAAQSLTWLWGAQEGISHGYNSLDYGLKAYIYLRYFGLYTGPILMSGLALIRKHWKMNRTVVMLAAPASMFFYVCWMVLIQPFIFENRNTSEFICGLSLYYATDKVELRHYMIGMFFLLAAGAILYWLIWKNRCTQMLVLLMLYLFAHYYLNGMGYEVNRQKRNWTTSNGGYYAVKEMEKSVEVPKTLYCYDSSDKTDHQLYYPYQFYLNRYEIIPATKETVTGIPKGQVVFSNAKNDETLLNLGYVCFCIDSNEYVYVDEANQEIMEYFLER